MTTLRPPFEGKSMEDLFKSIQNKPIPPVPSNYSSDLLEFIQICLKKKPSQRLTAKELLNYHTFQKYFKNLSYETDTENTVNKS
jgi:NIMA (never in mitosis gene a)-related kinase